MQIIKLPSPKETAALEVAFLWPSVMILNSSSQPRGACQLQPPLLQDVDFARPRDLNAQKLDKDIETENGRVGA